MTSALFVGVLFLRVMIFSIKYKFVAVCGRYIWPSALSPFPALTPHATRAVTSEYSLSPFKQNDKYVPYIRLLRLRVIIITTSLSFIET